MQTLTDSYQNGDKKVGVGASLRHSVSKDLVEEIMRALKSVKGYGSIEIYVQNHSVTQITVRNIKKTRHILAE